MFARMLPPELEALDFESIHLVTRFDKGELCPRE